MTTSAITEDTAMALHTEAGRYTWPGSFRFYADTKTGMVGAKGNENGIHQMSGVRWEHDYDIGYVVGEVFTQTQWYYQRKCAA